MAGWLANAFGLAKAAEPAPKGEVRPRGHNIDDRWLVGLGDMLEVFSDGHPGGSLGYGDLVVAGSFAPLSAIRTIRINQFAEHLTPRVNDNESGFRIRLRDRRKQMTRSLERRAYAIEQTLLRGAGKYGYGSFELDMRALMNDSFLWDQAVAQILKTRGRTPTGLLPMDGSTFRLAVPSGDAKKTGQWWPEKNCYVQIGRELLQPVAEFDHDEMIWGVRRPRTWQQVGRYGNPEIEELAGVIRSLVNATTFNDVNFTNGVHANTIIALKSGMSTPMWDVFMRQLKAMTMGVRNAKRTVPIKIAKDESMEIHKLGGSNLEMEFSTWINWLLKIVCALYAMDPAELGFVFGNEGQSSSMGGNANAQSRITASKERGLRPLLRCVQGWLDRLVFMIDPEFAFEFVGLGALSPKELHEMRVEAVKHWMTVNEVRAQEDLDEIDHPMANVPLNDLFRDAATGNPQESDGADVIPFPGMEPDLGDEAEAFAKAALSGVDWRDTAAWTLALVKSGDDALKTGRLRSVPYSRPVGGRTAHRLLPSAEPGVRAYVVEIAA